MDRRIRNGIAFAIVSVILTLLTLPLMNGSIGGGGGDCLSSMKRAFAACQMYAVENDERFPDAGSWMDRVLMIDPLPFKCDKVESGYGLAFNTRYSSAVAPSSTDDPRALLYDSTKLGRNEHDAFESLPRPGRHKGGNNVVYADGEAQFHRD